jgi:hypothetical protein
MNLHQTAKSLITAFVVFANGLHAQETARSSSTPAPAFGSPAKPEAASAEWLRGKWVFDEEHTQKKYTESEKADGLDAIKDALVFPQLFEKLKGAHLSITDKEVIMTTRDGNGKAFAYQLSEVPDANSVTLKQTDGEVTTYHKEGERFWIASTGNVNIPFYFKRAK